MITKPPGSRAKAGAPVTKAKVGRPPIAGRAMSNAERQRRHRVRPRPPKSADEIFESICTTRNLSTPAECRLAELATAALVDGDLPEAIRALDALPPTIHVRSETPTMTGEQARAEILQLVMNLAAAGRIEMDLDFDGSENDALRRKVAALQAELAALRSAAAAPATAGAAEPAKSPDMSNVTPLRPEPKAEPKASAEPVTPLPEPTQSWDSTPNAAAWRAWRANNPDGYDGGGVV